MKYVRSLFWSIEDSCAGVEMAVRFCFAALTGRIVSVLSQAFSAWVNDLNTFKVGMVESEFLARLMLRRILYRSAVAIVSVGSLTEWLCLGLLLLCVVSLVQL